MVNQLIFVQFNKTHQGKIVLARGKILSFKIFNVKKTFKNWVFLNYYVT